jgi:hypothetical protein
MNSPARLAVEKAMEQLDFIARSFNLELYPIAKRQDLVDDLVVMREHDDLEYVILQLLDGRSTIRFEFRIEFAADGSRGNLRDSAAGVEVPVLPPGLITSLRLLASRHRKMDLYRHLLKNPNWSPAPSLPRDAGDLIEPEHIRCVTGGQQQGRMFVDAGARHRIVITHVVGPTYAPTYAFGRDLTLGGRDGVFLLPKFAAPGLTFQPGLQVLAVVLSTPRGLQARAIQPAS